jgi:hypothetical protein
MLQQSLNGFVVDTSLANNFCLPRVDVKPTAKKNFQDTRRTVWVPWRLQPKPVGEVGLELISQRSIANSQMTASKLPEGCSSLLHSQGTISMNPYRLCRVS